MGWLFRSTLNKKGESALYYSLDYRGKKLIFPAGFSIPPDKFVGGKVVHHKKSGTYNTRILTIQLAVNKYTDEARASFPPWTTNKLKEIIDIAIDGGQVEADEVKSDNGRLSYYWILRIEQFRKEGKIRSVDHHELSISKVIDILGEETRINEITTKHLNLIKDKLILINSASSVHGYLRDLRAVINRFIADGSDMRNPFLGFKMPKLTQKTNVALTWEEYQDFKATTKLKTEYQQMVRDMFVFRYECMGMRIGDQLSLTWNNFREGRLIYSAGKTSKVSNFELSQTCIDIINRWGQRKEKFIFPPIKTGEMEEVREASRQQNKALKRIAGYLKIDKSLSTHSARHTFASLNMHLGAFDLRDALQHGSVKTTEGYLATLKNQDELARKVRR